MNHQQLAQLAGKIADGTATEEEIVLYNQWLSSVGEESGWNEAELGNYQETADILKQRIYKNAGIRKRGLTRNIVRVSVAAAVVTLFVALGIKLRKTTKEGSSHAPMAGKAILPGGSRAMLTLANGETVQLDSTVSHTMQQGGSTIQLGNGQVMYVSNTHSGTPEYNTLSTPAGGQYQLVLPDGSKVWLNAASSLRFPSGFTGEERRVELKGEAYFEVTADAAKPFVVQAGDNVVHVLGTQFNFMAYNEEPSADVTLLDGAVKVIHQTDSATLRPGQQARLADNQKITLVKHADTEKITAWKNGYFSLNGEGTEVVMRQLSRWYNTEVVYAGSIPDLKFEGSIKRSYELADVLAILGESGIRFRMEGRKIVVLP
ncbi:FecR domain-containing protein [Chitinophaga sp. 212800010-3]|uniref:FecR family protein n=1 Tax=unclassified Chitinophaga TaxID=2619133 RepID=UPI002DF45199|nr:FecR family protein [Chitinophaga sp. 212800010-3]